MKIAALYDIHGNLPALEAVLAEVDREKVDRIVVGGDVLPGPMPRETLDCLLGLDTPVGFLSGNGEAAVLAHLAGRELEGFPQEARDAVRWVAEQLRPEHKAAIAAWPPSVRIAIAGHGEVLFCHATPRSDTEIFTRATPDSRLLPIFEPLGVSTVVCGHTHMQFDRTVGTTRVVNAGSVGMPFGDAGAYWLLLQPEVSFRRTAYYYAKGASRIRSTSYPGANDFAQNYVLRPRSESEVLALYSRIEPSE